MPFNRKATEAVSRLVDNPRPAADVERRFPGSVDPQRSTRVVGDRHAVPRCSTNLIGSYAPSASRSTPRLSRDSWHEDQLIRAECDAWICLLTAMPDYPCRRSAAQLTPGQLELENLYLVAHANRVLALG